MFEAFLPPTQTPAAAFGQTPAPTPAPTRSASGGKPLFERKVITKINPMIAFSTDKGIIDYLASNPATAQALDGVLNYITTQTKYRFRTSVTDALASRLKGHCEYGIPWKDFTGQDGVDYQQFNPVQIGDGCIDVAGLLIPASLENGKDGKPVSAGVKKIKYGQDVFALRGPSGLSPANLAIVILKCDTAVYKTPDVPDFRTGGSAVNLVALAKHELMRIPVFNLASPKDVQALQTFITP